MKNREAGLQPEAVEAKKSNAISYEGCAAALGKGEAVDPKAKLEQNTAVTDTGAYADFLTPYQEQSEFTPDQIDQIYQETITSGIIDHHSIDSFFASKGIKSEKCATQMVADYPEAVLELIKVNGVKQVETHFDSDMDAICSAYLTKSLIDNGQLPGLAEKLASITNMLDYGRLSELGEDYNAPENFVQTLPGVFSSLKSAFSEVASQRIKKEGFSPAILAEAEAQRNAAFFEILNLAEQSGVDVTGDISVLDSQLSEELLDFLKTGQESIKEEYKQFQKEFAKAETIETQNGDPVIIAKSPKPLTFTNLAYLQTSPETIVAVFGGLEREANDHYDIGIQPDQAKNIDLRGLCLALNKTERKKRDQILVKDDSEKTDAEKELVTGWQKEKTREAFAGLNEMIDNGEVNENDVLDIDPTVLVAGNSLIAASRSALLTQSEFTQTIKEFFKSQK
ncbi:hypothetical protein ACFLZY_01450 [Patescibacteria group bacterium]